MSGTRAELLALLRAVREALNVPLPANASDHVQRYQLQDARHSAIAVALDEVLDDDRADVAGQTRRLEQRTAELPIRYRRFPRTAATGPGRQASSQPEEGGNS